MTDVFPQRNLPDQAEAWGREIEDRIKDIQKQVSVVSNTTRNTNLVAVKSAEAADHNVRRVEVQVEALEAAVNEKTRAVLDEAIEELREAEIVMEAQFEAHDTALGEAETAITGVQSELGTLDGRITSAVQDAAALSGRVDDAEQAIVDAQADLVTAQDAADQALADALAAQSAADTADAKATTADARITIGTANPTATDAVGKPEGAIWEVWSSGKALRRFVLRSGAWVQTGLGPDFVGENAIGDAQVSSLSVGKLSGAVGEFTEAVVGKMTGHAAFLRNLLAQRVVIGSAENLIPNGSGEFGGLGGWTPSAGMTWDASDAPTGLPGSFVRVKGGGTAVPLMELVPVEPGGEYFYELWMKADVPDSRIYVQFRNQDGTTPGGHYAIPGIESGGNLGTNDPGPAYAVTNKLVPTEWTRIAGRLVMGATTNAIRLSAIFYNHTNGSERNAEVKLAGLRLMKRAAGELIVDGAISARHVEAESVAAAVGVFIDAMMQNLTVTGVANISTAVADQLYAKLAVVDKLQATSGIVTKDMIATGAITSEKIAANAVSAAMVDVGQNAKWDSNGLVFYAPPQPGQAYDDWENRTPIIQIRPDGSSSVQVGDSAGLHGGITPSGLVYGTAGDFETITVGGQDFATAVTEGPRGVISAVAPANGINATTSNGPYLLTKFTPEPGRMYRITFGFKGGAASAENVLVADFRQARPGASGGGSASRRLAELVMLAARASGGGASGITHIDVGGDYLLADSTYLTDGETVIWIYVRTTAGTFYLNGAGSGQITSFPVLKIEDIGVAYEVETQTVSSTSPPPPSKVTKTDYIWSGNAVGVRPDGSTAPDSRLTLGGYNIFGSDMAEFIWYPFNLSRLNGSTVNEALVQLTITQTYSGGQIAYYMDASTNRLSGRANLSQGWGGPGGSHDRIVPSGNLSRLIGKGGILIAPYNVGSTSSYGYFATKALMRVKYTK